ncbi:aminoglycoside phosphotransferase family protein [Streptomyces sp. NPDC058953]|uniref:aminoglycoside phosphotransferase family protein n=1 Tax=unclassified Streptomyces TaxID=2593676 RepID=UPI00368BC721
MTITATPERAVLEEACSAVGLVTVGAEALRIAENQVWRLPGNVIARISRPGQMPAAVKEVRVARWLAESGIPVVRPLDAEQPVVALGYPVTFWTELPPHGPGTVMDVAEVLTRIHALPVPEGFELGRLEPFVRLEERIDSASTLSADDRQWLHQLRRGLHAQWGFRPAGRPDCPVHGDAWVGNVVRTATGRTVMDLERFSVGPPEWDLVSTAVKLTTTGTVTADEYAEFCRVYGADVTEWEGYALFADIRTLRMVTYAALHAAGHPEWTAQAQYRVDCLRGRAGPRPWRWRGIM